jgi:CspA family cold shock protein
MTTYSDSERPEITHRQITATVKWFNPTKGFGFVQPSDGSGDAFLHISVIEQSGHRSLPEGATIVCDLSAGQKGPQVAEVYSVESLPATPPQGAHGDGTQVEGTVKFYNAEKGFGFIVPDDGGKDVFISARVLERAGMQNLGPDQRVRVIARAGQKGPTADSIEII